MLKEYQKKRILVFLDPDLDPLHAGYQLIQSKIAVGSGGFFGKGFRLGTQSQLRFLPEQHTDFVFSVWSEEWGLVGCCVVVFLYFLFFYRGMRISYNCKNFYGSYFAAGITFFFFMQFLNKYLHDHRSFSGCGGYAAFFQLWRLFHNFLHGRAWVYC